MFTHRIIFFTWNRKTKFFQYFHFFVHLNLFSRRRRKRRLLTEVDSNTFDGERIRRTWKENLVDDVDNRRKAKYSIDSYRNYWSISMKDICWKCKRFFDEKLEIMLCVLFFYLQMIEKTDERSDTRAWADHNQRRVQSRRQTEMLTDSCLNENLKKSRMSKTWWRNIFPRTNFTAEIDRSQPVRAKTKTFISSC